MGKLYVGNSGSTPAIIKVEEVPKIKFGATVDTFLGDVDENGELQRPSEPFEFNGTGIKTLGTYSLAYKFASLLYLSSVNLSDLIAINGDYACYYTFNHNKNITSTGLNNLVTITGESACYSMYRYCTGLTSTGLNNLVTITGESACHTMFQNCSGLTKEYFPMLTDVRTANAMGTSSSNGMFAGCKNITELHFRADAQARIEALSGYASKFGATNATIYFDL